ncbi:MAG: hypothetical protein MI810_18370 [Flavobacteriales bacterium]|nr:hypothetical protein [Flavobacteriales bacterium]
MIKKGTIFFALGALLTACGGYTEEQAKAADAFCDCMSKEGDFDILFYECDMEIVADHGGEVMADEGWGLALEEKCPDVAGQIAEE